MSTACPARGSLAEGTWVEAASPSPEPPCCSWDTAANPAWCEALPISKVVLGEELHRGSASGASAGGFACTCKSARPRLQWTPSGCQLPAWNATRFCALLGGKKLLFVGDSTMQQTASVVSRTVTVNW